MTEKRKARGGTGGRRSQPRRAFRAVGESAVERPAFCRRKGSQNVMHNLEELEKRIGYIFQDKMLLKQALTHSSFANEQKINRWEIMSGWNFSETPCWSWFPAISVS